MKRAQIRRGKPLETRTRLSRYTGLQPGPWSHAVPLLDGTSAAGRITPSRAGKSPAAGRPDRRQGKNAAARNSGPTPEVRALVLGRDGYACVCCGRSIIGKRYSLGHRKRASQGGRAVPSNLLVFLGWGGEACHGRIDSRRDRHDEAKGYTVRSWQDPAQVGVMVFGPGGSGVTKYLWDDGTYQDEPQSAVAA